MEKEKKPGIPVFYRTAWQRVFLFAARFCAFAVVFSLLVMMPCSCGGQQLGETKAEAARRHIRNDRISRGQMRADIDAFMLTDEPSKLTDKRIP